LIIIFQGYYRVNPARAAHIDISPCHASAIAKKVFATRPPLLVPVPIANGLAPTAACRRMYPELGRRMSGCGTVDGGLPALLTTGHAKALGPRPNFHVLRKPYQISALGRAVRNAIDLEKVTRTVRAS
jgi:hypothetical protein